jgi:hypothetical protein
MNLLRSPRRPSPLKPSPASGGGHGGGACETALVTSARRFDPLPNPPPLAGEGTPVSGFDGLPQ